MLHNVQKLAEIGVLYPYPGGNHFSVQSILLPSLQQGKISSDRVNEKIT